MRETDDGQRAALDGRECIQATMSALPHPFSVFVPQFLDVDAGTEAVARTPYDDSTQCSLKTQAVEDSQNLLAPLEVHIRVQANRSKEINCHDSDAPTSEPPLKKSLQTGHSAVAAAGNAYRPLSLPITTAVLQNRRATISMRTGPCNQKKTWS
jgi:hypothetical protein